MSQMNTPAGPAGPAGQKPVNEIFHEEVTEKIIAQLKDGAAPWQKTWAAGELRPAYNPASDVLYSGLNRLNLGGEGFADPRFMSLRQANNQGLRVKKGEKGRKVVYYQFQKDAPVPGPDGKPSLDAESRPITKKEPLERPILRLAPVFHVSQLQDTDGNPVPSLARAELAANPHDKTESLLQASGVAVKHDQRDRSFYRAATDAIHMPPKAAFDSEEKYYSAVLHELTHSAGHESRLNREKSPLGSPEYAKEELRAQIAAWMLAQDLGAAHHPAQSAAYVETWVKVLEKDPYEIVRACRDAEKIKEYVLGRELEQQKGPQQTAGVHVDAHNVYLDVPFKEKDLAKAAGAKWDVKEMSWYAPAGADLEKFKEWIPEASLEQGQSGRQASVPEKAPVIAQEKNWLDVPFAEKDQAKEAGAKWDMEAKSWYAPEGADLNKLEAWLPLPVPEWEVEKERDALIAISAGSRHITAVEAVRELERDFDLEQPDMRFDRQDILDAYVGTFGYRDQLGSALQPYDKRTAYVDALENHVLLLRNPETFNDLNPYEKYLEFEAGLRHTNEEFDLTYKWEQDIHPHRYRAIAEMCGMFEYKAELYLQRTEGVSVAEKKEQDAIQDRKFAVEKGQARAVAGQKTRQHSVLPPEQEFAQALAKMGLDLKGHEPIMDGVIHRAPVFEGKPGNLDGAYVGHLDEHPAGFIQNHKSGEVTNWKYSGHVLTQEHKRELSAEAMERKAEQELERQAERERSEKRAYAKYANATPAVLMEEKHPYLVKKGIEACGAATDGKGNLLISGQNADGRIQTVQTINPEGEKRFEKGCTKTGAFFIMNSRERLFKHDKALPEEKRPLLIAEGFATAASIHMATNYPVIVAFDSSNLKHVAEAVHARRPEAPILVCGDNDHSREKNVGLQAAMETALAVGGRFVVPSFTNEEKAKGLTDFNDLHQSRGLETVAKQVGPELKKALEKSRGKEHGAGLSLGHAVGV